MIEKHAGVLSARREHMDRILLCGLRGKVADVFTILELEGKEWQPVDLVRYLDLCTGNIVMGWPSDAWGLGASVVGRRHWSDDPIVACGNEILTPDDSLKVVNHSPTGFEFGYPGSGPAQLAFAILQKLQGDDLALALYQYFKDDFLARCERYGFEIRIDAIRLWVKTTKDSPKETPLR